MRARSDVIPMVGKRYGRLTVLAEAGLRRYETSTPRRLVVVRCDCGREYEVRAETLRRAAGNARPVSTCRACALLEQSRRRVEKRTAAA